MSKFYNSGGNKKCFLLFGCLVACLDFQRGFFFFREAGLCSWQLCYRKSLFVKRFSLWIFVVTICTASKIKPLFYLCLCCLWDWNILRLSGKKKIIYRQTLRSSPSLCLSLFIHLVFLHPRTNQSCYLSYSKSVRPTNYPSIQFSVCLFSCPSKHFCHPYICWWLSPNHLSIYPSIHRSSHSWIHVFVCTSINPAI